MAMQQELLVIIVSLNLVNSTGPIITHSGSCHKTDLAGAIAEESREGLVKA